MSQPFQILLSGTQLGQMLQSGRKARKMSQVALASRIGMSQSRVSYLELHAQELSVEQLLAWCSVLGLELALGPRGGKAQAAPETDW